MSNMNNFDKLLNRNLNQAQQDPNPPNDSSPLLFKPNNSSIITNIRNIVNNTDFQKDSYTNSHYLPNKDSHPSSPHPKDIYLEKRNESFYNFDKIDSNFQRFISNKKISNALANNPTISNNYQLQENQSMKKIDGSDPTSFSFQIADQLGKLNPELQTLAKTKIQEVIDFFVNTQEQNSLKFCDGNGAITNEITNGGASNDLGKIQVKYDMCQNKLLPGYIDNSAVVCAINNNQYKHILPKVICNDPSVGVNSDIVYDSKFAMNEESPTKQTQEDLKKPQIQTQVEQEQKNGFVQDLECNNNQQELLKQSNVESDLNLESKNLNFLDKQVQKDKRRYVFPSNFNISRTSSHVLNNNILSNNLNNSSVVVDDRKLETQQDFNQQPPKEIPEIPEEPQVLIPVDLYISPTKIKAKLSTPSTPDILSSDQIEQITELLIDVFYFQSTNEDELRQKIEKIDSEFLEIPFAIIKTKLGAPSTLEDLKNLDNQKLANSLLIEYFNKPHSRPCNTDCNNKVMRKLCEDIINDEFKKEINFFIEKISVNTASQKILYAKKIGEWGFFHKYYRGIYLQLLKNYYTSRGGDTINRTSINKLIESFDTKTNNNYFQDHIEKDLKLIDQVNLSVKEICDSKQFDCQTTGLCISQYCLNGIEREDNSNNEDLTSNEATTVTLGKINGLGDSGIGNGADNDRENQCKARENERVKKFRALLNAERGFFIPENFSVFFIRVICLCDQIYNKLENYLRIKFIVTQRDEIIIKLQQLVKNLNKEESVEIMLQKILDKQVEIPYSYNQLLFIRDQAKDSIEEIKSYVDLVKSKTNGGSEENLGLALLDELVSEAKSNDPL